MPGPNMRRWKYLQHDYAKNTFNDQTAKKTQLRAPILSSQLGVLAPARHHNIYSSLNCRKTSLTEGESPSKTWALQCFHRNHAVHRRDFFSGLLASPDDPVCHTSLCTSTSSCRKDNRS